MEKRKLIGLILLVVSVVAIVLNLVVIYPLINCTFAPLTFWLIALVCIIGGLIIYFDVKIFHSEET
ncbi:MAG: hypothetical protein ACW96X_07955 [Promethearchaeota archaeon]|jgi:hypothetical protein